MALAFQHVFMVLALYCTFCVSVNTLPMIQDNKQTNSENLRVYTRNKRSEVTSNFCRNKNEIWYHNKCRSLEEYRKLLDGTSDYEDFSSTDILFIIDTEEIDKDEVIYIKTSAASEPVTIMTTHQEATKVSSSTVAKEIQTVSQLDTTTPTSTSTARIPEKVHESVMKMSTFIWIIIGCAVFVVLCLIFLLFWCFCLRRNKNSTSYSLENSESNHCDAEAATLLKISDDKL